MEWMFTKGGRSQNALNISRITVTPLRYGSSLGEKSLFASHIRQLKARTLSQKKQQLEEAEAGKDANYVKRDLEGSRG